jgi:hypothetical protein
MSYPADIFDGANEYCVHCDDTFTDDCADAGHEPLVTDADFHWVICDRCQGDGTLTGYPGVYTGDDFAQDPDLYDEYMAHRRSCEDCDGTGKERVIHDEAMTRPGLEEWVRDYYDDIRTSTMERSMGA